MRAGRGAAGALAAPLGLVAFAALDPAHPVAGAWAASAGPSPSVLAWRAAGVCLGLVSLIVNATTGAGLGPPRAWSTWYTNLSFLHLWAAADGTVPTCWATQDDDCTDGSYPMGAYASTFESVYTLTGIPITITAPTAIVDIAVVGGNAFTPWPDYDLRIAVHGSLAHGLAIHFGLIIRNLDDDLVG